MKKVYLITVPSERQGEKPEQFVVENVASITGKYPFFMIQQIDYIYE